MPSHFAAVLFDLDGTLADTAPEIGDAVNDTLHDLGYAKVDNALSRQWIGRGTVELLATALADASGENKSQIQAKPAFAEHYQKFATYYAARCGTSCALYAGVLDAVQHLHAQGIHLALVTNKEKKFSQLVMERLDLSRYFSVQVYGDSFATKKPHPYGVFHCLSQWGLVPEQALFIGDSEIDVATARAAGMPIWALTWGYNQGKPISSAKPDKSMDNMQPLLQITAEDKTPTAAIT